MEPDTDDDEDHDIANVRLQLQNEMEKRASRTGDLDVIGMQLELDLIRKAYHKLQTRNNVLKEAMATARDKVHELKAEKRELKRQLNLSNSRSGSRPSDSESAEENVGL